MKKVLFVLSWATSFVMVAAQSNDLYNQGVTYSGTHASPIYVTRMNVNTGAVPAPVTTPQPVTVYRATPPTTTPGTYRSVNTVPQTVPQNAQPYYYNSQWSPQNPAPVPGVETGCSAFPRGSQEELDCETDGYRSSSMLRSFQTFLIKNQDQVSCGRYSAVRQNLGDHIEVSVSDRFNSFTVGYRGDRVLIPNDVESTVLWQTRDRVLKMLYACRDMGLDTGYNGYLPPVTSRVRTQGEFSPAQR